jgi:ribonuclease HI
VKSGVIYIDGGSRGNPGESGYGIVLVDAQGQPNMGSFGYLGIQTNNFAEYQALLEALKLAQKLELKKLEIRSDSELLVRQMEGRYRVKSPTLKPLHEQAKGLVSSFTHFSIKHIPRALNSEADRLANEAMNTRKTDLFPYPAEPPINGGTRE